jgi:uncharacterized protein YoxC
MSVLSQVRKTVAEAERLFININDELPDLIGQIHAMSQNIIELTQQVRIGVEHTAALLHAVGEVGESIQHVHGFVKGSSGAMLTKVASMVTGLTVGAKVVKGRFSTSPRTFPLHAAAENMRRANRARKS